MPERRGGRHSGKWGSPLDSDICLDLIVGAFRKLCQVEQTLSVPGEERRDVDERPDLAGTRAAPWSRLCLPYCCRHDRRFGAGGQNLTQTGGVGIQGGAASGV